MKEFSEWVGSMINSIEDNSIIDRFAGDTLTPLQTRMCIANLLVPYTTTAKSIADWLAVFSVALDGKPIGKRCIMESNLKQLLGDNNMTTYFNIYEDEESAKWIKEIKKAIKYDTLDRR